MALDYQGTPARDFKRNLKDPLNPLSLDDNTVLEQIAQVPDDLVFDELAKVYMKGNHLLNGLAAMDPAGFIPVKEGDSVKVAIQRLNPSGATDAITFGMFKTASEFIANRASALDEEFLLAFDVIDPAAIGSTVTKKHKDQNDSKKDWITDFLVGLSPIAGMIISGYVADAAMTSSLKVPVPDGPVAGTQPTTYHAQGLGVGLALLIEIGAKSLIFFNAFTSDNDALSPEVREKFEELSNSPTMRQEVLEAAGYDYEALTQNRRFDDHMEIKTYSLNYISSRDSSVRYDHWIAWANVLENQSLISGSIAMAPTFSNRWKKFSETNDPSVVVTSKFTIDDDPIFTDDDADAELDFKDAIETGLTQGLKNYFSSVLTVSDTHYSKAYATFSMQLDPRLLCCILWFLGPLDTDNIAKMAQILRLLALSINVNWRDLLGRITEDTLASVLNMIAAYVSKIITGIFNDILQQMFKIPNTDLEVAFQKCIGIEIIFNLIQKAMIMIAKQMNLIIKELNALLFSIGGKATANIEVSAERRWMVVLAGMMDAIVDKLDLAKEGCTFEQDIDPAVLNELAADAAVDFVSTQLPDQFPILVVPEDVRRKFFKDIPTFTTKNLELEVQGTDSSGNSVILTREQTVADCGEGGRAAEGVALGAKIAKIMKGQ